MTATTVFWRSSKSISLKGTTKLGVHWSDSEKIQRRVMWSNQLVILTLGTLVFFSAVQAVVAFDGRTIANRVASFFIIASVLLLNKFGFIVLSRLILVMNTLVSVTVTALVKVDSRLTLLFVLPIAMSFTILDPFSEKKPCISLVVLTTVVFTVVQYVQIGNQTDAANILAGLTALLIVSFCFHLLAKENRDTNDEKLKKVVVGLQEEVKARKIVEASLRKATQAKQDFLATMSHEIRTPMNGVIGSVDLLSGTTLNAEQQDLADTIKSSAMALITIINDILDFSKIEAGKMTIENVPFNVRVAAEEVLDCVAFLADERGVELVCDVAGPLLSDGVVLSDPGRFRQVLLNLIGNAVKFTQQDGSVSVTARLSDLPPHTTTIASTPPTTGGGGQTQHSAPNLARQTTTTTIFHFSDSGKDSSTSGSSKGGAAELADDTNSFLFQRTSGLTTTRLASSRPSAGSEEEEGGLRLLHVEVKDTGVGIAPDRLETLFQAFTQADSSTSRTHGGTGLGLTICSKLVELMGGKIGAQSQLGQGSTFSFFMVVGTRTGGDLREAAAPPMAKRSHASARPRRINSDTTPAPADPTAATTPNNNDTTSGGGGVVTRAAAETTAGAAGSEGERRRSSSILDRGAVIKRKGSAVLNRITGGGGGRKKSQVGVVVSPQQKRPQHHLSPFMITPVSPMRSGERSSSVSSSIQEDEDEVEAGEEEEEVVVVVVVCEPLARSRDALCRLLNHHRDDLPHLPTIALSQKGGSTPQQPQAAGGIQQQHQQGGGENHHHQRLPTIRRRNKRGVKVRMVVRPVPHPADLGALVQVLEEEEEAQVRERQRRSTVVVVGRGSGSEGGWDEMSRKRCNWCNRLNCDGNCGAAGGGGGYGGGGGGSYSVFKQPKLVVVCDYRSLLVRGGEGGSAAVMTGSPSQPQQQPSTPPPPPA